MTPTRVSIQVPPPVASPRGAALLGGFAAFAYLAASRLLHALHGLGTEPVRESRHA